MKKPWFCLWCPDFIKCFKNKLELRLFWLISCRMSHQLSISENQTFFKNALPHFSHACPVTRKTADKQLYMIHLIETGWFDNSSRNPQHMTLILRELQHNNNLNLLWRELLSALVTAVEIHCWQNQFVQPISVQFNWKNSSWDMNYLWVCRHQLSVNSTNHPEWRETELHYRSKRLSW